MKTRYLLLLIVLFAFPPAIAFAQIYSCSGRVYDAATGRALAFVNIVTNNSNTGTATDIDGKFHIRSARPIEYLVLSYVGYEQKTFYLHGRNRNLKIEMQKKAFELEEVEIVAGENPAHRIIKNVIANRKNNDPENLESFAYTSYDKMVFTVDTLEIPDEMMEEEVDSGNVRLRKFIRDKDFFLMETVSERKFMAPDRNHEKVLASRISGFRDPVFLFLGSQLQSPSFYKDFIAIFDQKYINPISKGSIRKYYFNIEDTTYTANNDTVFVISYKPRSNTNFDGLKGVLSINTHGWAIQNVIAEPARDEDNLRVRIQQMYELIDSTKWFPVQLNTDITLRNVSINKYAPTGRGKTYIRDIELNPELVRRMFNQVTVEVSPKAGDRSRDFWIDYRGDSLTERERRTYEFIDSIGQAQDLDRKAATIKSLLNNRLPLGVIDLNLSQIINYNQYEGLYLGLGLLTNKKFSQALELGGYWGYGFGDKKAKYGGDISLTIDRYREIKLRLAYFDDVTESGSVHFFGESERLLDPENYRDLLIKRMNPTVRKQAAISFRALRYARLNLALTLDEKTSPDNYLFNSRPTEGNMHTTGDFRFTELSAGIRYAYKEKFLQMPDSRISLGTNYPVFWFKYTRGLSGTFDGEYNYNRYDLKLIKTFRFKYLGSTTLDLRAGYIDQPVPYANLFNGPGSYRPFTIHAPGSFATMRMNEFLSDRYIYLFVTHDFGKLLWRSSGFSPEFALATNLGIGDLKHPNFHEGVGFKLMNELYLESGLLINSILDVAGIYTLGAGVFYRYGYYHLPETGKNLAWKINLKFPF